MATRFPYSSAAFPVGAALSPYYVMLASPVAEKPCTKYAVSLAGTVETLVRANVRFEIETLTGCCHVDDARNVIIRNFLQSDCTDLFFLDADLGWQPNNVLRLLKLPGDIVCGVYPHKNDASSKESYPFHPFEGETETNEFGLFPMPKGATGFMRIRRPVIEALYEREKSKDRLMWLDGDNEQLNKIPVARICERGFVRELGLEHLSRTQASQSGDYVLCLKARLLGFDVSVQPDMEFWHCGEKTWHGNLANQLRREKHLDRPKFEEALKSIEAGVMPDIAMLDQLVSENIYGIAQFAMPGEALHECYRMASDACGHILEVGSGLSTLVMGIALRGTSHRVYAIEHDLEWIEHMQEWLQRYGIYNVYLIHAPLTHYDQGVWHAVNSDELPECFDGVLIDGPKRDGKVNRNIVFDVLYSNMLLARTWIIDDTEKLTELQPYLQARTVSLGRALSAGMPHHYVVAKRDDPNPIVMTHYDIKTEAAE